MPLPIFCNRTDLQAMTGKDLQGIRLERNLTVKEFAKALGCTPASIYRWESKAEVLNLQARFTEAIGVLIGRMSTSGSD